jgi:hypothetical protein
MLKKTPNAVQKIVFEICGNKPGVSMGMPEFRLPSCGWYYAKYDPQFWGGTAMNSLEMMRDGDDQGVPSNPFDPNMPLINFQKDSLFNPDQPLFNDMIVGNYVSCHSGIGRGNVVYRRDQEMILMDVKRMI